jgi:ABC-2 type transport system ATP-binding protein
MLRRKLRNLSKMPEAIIEAKNIRKAFGKTVALDGLSLSVEKGTIHALLGPNGAGKTTLVRLLSTLSYPDSGEMKVAGFDVCNEPSKVRHQIGLAGQFAAVDDFLTGRETLEMVGSLYHMSKSQIKKKANELLEKLRLMDAADRPAKTYSGGMRRRLDVGASLVYEPKVIFLDEPTTGLDPRTRNELWEMIRGLVKDGSTILLTTQYMEEADALADYITVIDKGGVVAEGTPLELKKSLGRDVVEVHFTKEQFDKGSKAVLELDPSAKLDEEACSIGLPAKEGSKTLLDVAAKLKKLSIEPEEISLHRPSLDDVFLAVTGKKTNNSK